VEFKISNKNIWFISFPVIISVLTEKILEITDVIFLGRYGVVELGAAAIGASIYDLCLFLPLGLIDGIQIIIGRRAGESKYFEIGSTFNQGLYLLFLSSILMTIFLIFLTPYLSEIVFSSGDITSSVFQCILCWDCTNQGINWSYNNFSNYQHHFRLPTNFRQFWFPKTRNKGGSHWIDGC
jgi:Na+-driven multidrug efflux pump